MQSVLSGPLPPLVIISRVTRIWGKEDLQVPAWDTANAAKPAGMEHYTIATAKKKKEKRWPDL